MKKINSQKTNKKGIMLVWSNLFGIILSAIALLIIVQLISSIFLQTPTNLKIAQNNADSIKEFIDYSSSGKYGKLNSCFNMLKLHHLESFQFAEGEKNSKNYFYIIDSEAVYVIPYKYKENFYENGNPKTLSVYKSEFKSKNEINIIYDETEQGNYFGGEFDVIPFLVTLSFGQSDEHLNIKKSAKYIALFPKISDGSFIDEKSKKVFYESYSQNKLETQIILDENIEKIEDVEGNYLIYRNEDKKLFVSSGITSDMIVDKYLCSFLYLNKQDQTDYLTKQDENGDYTNIKDIDYINKKITITYKLEDTTLYSNKFTWQNGPHCYDNNIEIDCTSILDSFNSNIKFMNFVEITDNYFKQDNIPDGKFQLSLSDLTINEIKEYTGEISFNEVFDEYVDTNGKSINIFQLDKEAKKEFVFSLAKWWGTNNRKFNNIEKDYSNDVGYINGKAYFYVKGSEDNAKYYSFKSNWIQKAETGEKTIEFYFKGEKLEFSERMEFDKYGISIPILDEDDNKFFYWLKVPIEGKEYDIILSGTQISRMLPIKNK